MSQPRPPRRVLIANRGEIACRIIQTTQEMGLTAVAVYSEIDARALHVHRADEAQPLGGRTAQESYLDIDKILGAARTADCDAVHPGYGFLSENADFAAAVEKAGLVFVGPPSPAIRAMGSKAAARQLMEDAGVPVVPGYHGEDQTPETFHREAERIGYPLLIKATAGGGGKGMRIVQRSEDLPAAIDGARREAAKAFGNERLLIERYVQRPRHIEFQILGDSHGHVIHLYERECSIQRRHQKILEEAPAPGLSPELRLRMGEAAVAAARAIDYCNAGTVEFVVDGDGNFFFLEMNTRLQVEHSVTEATAGLDLVAWQLRIAAGEQLTIRQEDVVPRGHAIEVRLYAEDPDNGFLPSSGTLLAYREPRGTGFRVDSGVYSGYEVPVEYDPILAKLTAWGETRDEARRRLDWALGRTVILGIHSNRTFLREVLQHEAFIAGDTHTHFIEEHFSAERPPRPIPFEAWVAAALVETGGASPIPGSAEAHPSLDPWDRLGGGG